MTRPWQYSALPARPASRWPGGARIALWVAVGVEAYRADDGRTEDILPRGPAPDLVNAAWREYGNRVGAFRLFDRLTDLGVRPALLLNCDVYDQAEAVVVAARDAGAEIVAHGLSNSDVLTEMSSEKELAYIKNCRDLISRKEGRPPAGWSSPWLEHRPTTLEHLRQVGFDYVLDFRLDDQPVWLNTENGQILSIPYAAELNDSTTLIGRQIGAEEFTRMILDEFEEIFTATGDQALVMSVVLHSFISGQPFRLRAVVRALEQMVSRTDDIWITTPREIFEAVQANPDLAAGKGSR